MKAANKIVGEAVLREVERIIRTRGFEVSNHDDRPRYAPGDLVISNGNGHRLFAEVKGCGVLVHNGHSRGKPRSYPGRPHLTAYRHAWLAEEGGVYIFAIYEIENMKPVIVDLRWCVPKAVDPSAGVERYRIPQEAVRSLPILRTEDLVRLVHDAPEAVS